MEGCVELDFKDVRDMFVEWSHLAWDRGQWWGLENMVIYHRVP
jgi:hypothetical protein